MEEGTDAYLKIQHAIQNQLAAHGELVSREREKIAFALASHGKLLQGPPLNECP
jgi:hypothetical protein